MYHRKKLFEALKSMPNDKYPGNDGLTKEFFKKLWSEVNFYHFYHAFYTRRTLYFTKTSNYKIK